MKRYIYIMLYNEECFYSPARLALSPDFIQKQRERSSTKVSIANRTGPVPSKNRLGRMQAFAKGTNSGFLAGERERVFFPFQGQEVVRVAWVSHTKTREVHFSAVKHSGRRPES